MPPDGSFMRIATYGRGIWELSQIELVETTLVDDGTSCDQDGVLDNGETGTLFLTFANQGPNNLERIELTVTSTNPHVTFPFGNTVKFPPLHKNGDSMGSIRVALNGASGLEAAEFEISIVAPELELPSGLNVTATHRVNYDDVPALLGHGNGGVCQSWLDDCGQCAGVSQHRDVAAPCAVVDSARVVRTRQQRPGRWPQGLRSRRAEPRIAGAASRRRSADDRVRTSIRVRVQRPGRVGRRRR